MTITSKLFSYNGSPAFLEGQGEPDGLGQFVFSLVTYCGRLGKDDPDDAVWARCDAVALSACTLSLYTDVAFGPASAPTLLSEIELDDQELEIAWEDEGGPAAMAYFVRCLSCDPHAKVAPLDLGKGLPDDFDASKWVGEMNCYSTEELQ